MHENLTLELDLKGERDVFQAECWGESLYQIIIQLLFKCLQQQRTHYFMSFIPF